MPDTNTTFAAEFALIERALEAQCDTRICPACNGIGLVETPAECWPDCIDGTCHYVHVPYTDTCSDCDGSGEITVAPIEEGDLPADDPLDDALRCLGRAAQCERHGYNRTDYLGQAASALKLAGRQDIAARLDAAQGPFRVDEGAVEVLCRELEAMQRGG